MSMSHPGRCFSIDQPLTEVSEDADRFYELLKSAAPTSSPGDDGESTVGVNPDAYEDPPDRESGNVDALWGESDLPPGDRSGTAQHHTNAVWDEFKKSREKFLARNFNSYEPSAKNSRDVLKQNFDHFASGDHESSKPFTNEHSKRNPEVVDTVLTKTRRLLGRA